MLSYMADSIRREVYSVARQVRVDAGAEDEDPPINPDIMLSAQALGALQPDIPARGEDDPTEPVAPTKTIDTRTLNL